MNEREVIFRKIQHAVLRHHFDANETGMLERELNQLRAKLYEVVYPIPIARTLAPKATDIASSVETYSYKVFTPIGEAKLIAYQANDIPRVDVNATEVFGKVRPIGAAYGWTLNELRESVRTGASLPEVKARTARLAIERGIDAVLAKGTITEADGSSPNVGLNGLINNPYVDATSGGTILDGAWWLNPTAPDPDDILKNLTDLVASIPNGTKNVFYPDTILLPVAHYNYIKQTPFSTLSGESILTVFRKNNPEITAVQPWHKLDDAGATGKPRAIAYQKTPDVLEAVIPQEFESMPPEWRGFELMINCHARCGGVKVYQPTALKYMDFLTS